MEQDVKKFLSFNDRNIYFTAADGQWWIAIKPICEALGVHYEHQRELLKSDNILSQLPRQHRVVAADGKLRNMVCLPEVFIYGWIFMIQSDSEELQRYKLQCYELLYNHFHGTITERGKWLKNKTHAEHELEVAKAKLAESEEFKKVKELEDRIKVSKRQLQQIDKEHVSSQLMIWMSEEDKTENRGLPSVQPN